MAKRPSRKMFLVMTNMKTVFPDAEITYEQDSSGDGIVATFEREMTNAEQDEINNRMYDLIDKEFPRDNRDDYAPDATVVAPPVETKDWDGEEHTPYWKVKWEEAQEAFNQGDRDRALEIRDELDIAGGHLYTTRKIDAMLGTPA